MRLPAPCRDGPHGGAPQSDEPRDESKEQRADEDHDQERQDGDTEHAPAEELSRGDL